MSAAIEQHHLLWRLTGLCTGVCYRGNGSEDVLMSKMVFTACVGSFWYARKCVGDECKLLGLVVDEEVGWVAGR